MTPATKSFSLRHDDSNDQNAEPTQDISSDITPLEIHRKSDESSVVRDVHLNLIAETVERCLRDSDVWRIEKESSADARDSDRIVRRVRREHDDLRNRLRNTQNHSATDAWILHDSPIRRTSLALHRRAKSEYGRANKSDHLHFFSSFVVFTDNESVFGIFTLSKSE